MCCCSSSFILHQGKFRQRIVSFLIINIFKMFSTFKPLSSDIISKGFSPCVKLKLVLEAMKCEINPKHIFRQIQFHNFSKIVKILLENFLFYDVLLIQNIINYFINFSRIHRKTSITILPIENFKIFSFSFNPF